MYLDHYKDKLLEKISKLERKVALYESDDVIAAMNADYVQDTPGHDQVPSGERLQGYTGHLGSHRICRYLRDVMSFCSTWSFLDIYIQ